MAVRAVGPAPRRRWAATARARVDTLKRSWGLVVPASGSRPDLEVPYDHHANNRRHCRRSRSLLRRAVALAAFLAGYRGLTRDAYALDLRQFIAWCQEHKVRLFAGRRTDIECFARDLEA